MLMQTGRRDTGNGEAFLPEQRLEYDSDVSGTRFAQELGLSTFDQVIIGTT